MAKVRHSCFLERQLSRTLVTVAERENVHPNELMNQALKHYLGKRLAGQAVIVGCTLGVFAQLLVFRLALA